MGILPWPVLPWNDGRLVNAIVPEGPAFVEIK